MEGGLSTGGMVGKSAEATLPAEQHDEAVRLKELVATTKDQDELEKDIGRQADQMLLEQADERDAKRLEKTLAQKEKLVEQVRKLQHRLEEAGPSSTASKTRSEIAHLQPQIDALNTDLQQIQRRIDERHTFEDDGAEGEAVEPAAGQKQPGESRRDFLIRTGKITPFSKMAQALQRTSSNLADVMLDAEDNNDEEDASENEQLTEEVAALPMSHRNLLQPGFAESGGSSQAASIADDAEDRPRKKRKVAHASTLAESDEDESPLSDPDISVDEYVPEDANAVEPYGSDSEGEESDYAVLAEGRDDQPNLNRKKRKPQPRKRAKKLDDDEATENLAGVDDGNEQVYQARLEKWVRGRKAARAKAKAKTSDSVVKSENVGEDAENPIPIDAELENADEEEWYLPHPTRADAEFEGGLRIPGDIFPSLFDYQKTGVQWLWELYSQKVGGIIGDEMGLGKTIQVISFLAALHHSKQLNKPVIVVTPATVMKQWVNEFHKWWPPLRVSILHTSGSGMMDVKREKMLEDEMESKTYRSTSKAKKANPAAQRIVDRVVNEGHILVTTYSGLQSYAELLIPVDWGYAVLDEGHKIRNPNTSITIYSKELRTANRVILSGTPMQNNLTELWSLFDFTFPMRLGTLVNFRLQFEIPIKQGGYANASNLQVETALKCAETLKEAISPYLLQRFKVDVAADLPKKSEQVLFCRLTKLQRDHYEAFLSSNEMGAILGGKRQALFGIDILRKICNHPDLEDYKRLKVKPGYNYGNGNKSGKMQVVKALLELWRDTGHKTLLFAQHRIMLDILEKFLKTMGGFNYRRMDGTTQIKDRQSLVDEFNNDPTLHVFLLTTKVGGLGINLTGADRVIIYDPDWNPSTDVQARERAWRLGQKREVLIYRLMTAGTIEEKIYHRQIFKQFLTNKILRDPKQRQTFQLKDLHDLFTLGNADDQETETSGLFKGTEVQFKSDPEPSSAPSLNGDGLPTPPADTSDDPDKITKIVGIAHQEVFRGDPTTNTANPSTPQTSATNSPPSTTTAQPSNPRLLSTIFARSGVHSALEHDAIINGSSSYNANGTIRADPAIIAREARRVAAEAAKELQRAGEVARSVPVGTVTWTGTFGTSGRPGENVGGGGGASRGGRGASSSARGGPSSASILANLSARQDVVSSQQQREQQQPKGKDFMSLIRDYLLAHGGAVYTQMLIDHFNRFCRTPERTAEFKEMLRVIAVLDKGDGGASGGGARGRGVGRAGRIQAGGRGGRGKWVLKREFGGTA